DQLGLALGGADHLFQHRGELPARTAPGCPEVDQHRLAPRLLDDVLDERLGGRVLDGTVGGARRRSLILQHHHGFTACSRAPGPLPPDRWSMPAAMAIGPAARAGHTGAGGAAERAPAGPSDTATIRGAWPVAWRNFTRSSRAIDVVIVLSSG